MKLLTFAAVGTTAAIVAVVAYTMGSSSTPYNVPEAAPVTGCAGQVVGGGSGSADDVTVPAPPAAPPDVAALRAGNPAFQLATPSTPVTPPSVTPPVAGAAAGGCDGSYAGAAAGSRPGGATATWDPGLIISDEVFYNTTAMSVDQIRAFIADKNASCSADNAWCLRNLKVSYAVQPADEFCQAVPAADQVDAATAIAAFSTACGVNPQVMLVTLQKESQLLDRTDVSASSYNAAWGWNCPDSGPGGSANCDPRYQGFFNQGFNMAKQWSRYKVGIPAGKYRYKPNVTADIMWNVAESGCGGAPVTIRNMATASLYNYTPYQPNEASLSAYPGEGDNCSSYGNRNFFRMFQKYFGDTGGGAVPASVGGAGGTPITAGGIGTVPVAVSGNLITIPAVAHVPAEMQGQVVVAPSAEVAGAVAAGMTWIGLPYSWGGGGAGGPSTGLCVSGPAANDCNITGFDCSGLTSYIAKRWGASIPRLSRSQRDGGKGVSWDAALPGDIVGYDGHVTIYLGTFNGVRMQLEAPQSGDYVKVSRVRGGADSVVYRYW